MVAFLVILYMLLMSVFGQRLRGYLSASPSEATMLINREDAIIIDVRENNEYKEGHIVNSIHIPLSYLKDRLAELDKHKNKPVIVALSPIRIRDSLKYQALGAIRQRQNFPEGRILNSYSSFGEFNERISPF